jgi:SAM-dependent methyltransferase
MSDGQFDDRIAATYDNDVADRFDPALLTATVDVLANLAAGRPVLEFASGTGRVTLPLRQRDVDVQGIELSQAMTDRLLAKPGGDAIPVTIGDMASTQVGDSFGLVYLVFNTITNLLTQAEQVACFRNAAAHLEPGGHFLIEVNIPPLRRLGVGERFLPFDMREGHIGFDEIDVANQRSISHHRWVINGQAHSFASRHRFAWPAEYDLMAELAGMSLAHRWADWSQNSFTSESASHISVWQKPA